MRQVSQLTSDLMKEVCRLISLKQLFTALYDSKCGVCERMNGLHKSMLPKMCQENPNIWTDIYLLYSYREIAQASTGLSPFELVYGITVHGLHLIR